MNHWKGIHLRQIVPPGFITIPDVFETIGQHHFGAEWTGQEVDYVDRGPAFARPSQVFDGDSDIVKDMNLYRQSRSQVLDLLELPSNYSSLITNGEWVKATDIWRTWEGSAHLVRERRNKVFWIMYRLGMSGQIGYCYIRSDGSPSELDKSQWNCSFDVACDRFEHAALNAIHPMHRPEPWNDGRTYFPYFTGELLVQELNVVEALPKIPKASAPKVEPDELPKSRAARILAAAAKATPAEDLEVEAGKTDCRSATGAGNTVPFIPTGAQGRDSGVAAILTLLSERAKAGVLASGVGAEAAALAEAYKNDHRYRSEDGWPPMTKGTIENRIRARFRELKAAMK